MAEKHKNSRGLHEKKKRVINENPFLEDEQNQGV